MQLTWLFIGKVGRKRADRLSTSIPVVFRGSKISLASLCLYLSLNGYIVLKVSRYSAAFRGAMLFLSGRQSLCGS